MANTNGSQQALARRTAPVALTVPPSPLRTLGHTLGILALVAGGVTLGAYMLDMHAHTCEGCGHQWRHLGAFNVGDPESHTCSRCGTVQWWKDGIPHVFRNSLRTPPPNPLEARLLEAKQHQRLFEAPWERIARFG